MAKVFPEANYGRAVAKIYQCQGKNYEEYCQKLSELRHTFLEGRQNYTTKYHQKNLIPNFKTVSAYSKELI
jgi:hypothetical protein